MANLGENVEWFERLRVLLQDTRLCDTLVEATNTLPLPGVDRIRLHELIGDKRHNMTQKLQREPGLQNYSVEYALAVWVYTLEEVRVYFVINGCARSPQRNIGAGNVSPGLAACLPFMKFLDTALTHLPATFKFAGTCMRGVKHVYPDPANHDPKRHFPTGRDFFWYEFRSASTDLAVMGHDQFCGMDPSTPRTIFHIEATEAYSIAVFSEFGVQESEVLFRPLAKFRVVHAAKLCDPTQVLMPGGGFPDNVVLQQLSPAAPPPAPVPVVVPAPVPVAAPPPAPPTAAVVAGLTGASYAGINMVAWSAFGKGVGVIALATGGAPLALPAGVVTAAMSVMLSGGVYCYKRVTANHDPG